MVKQLFIISVLFFGCLLQSIAQVDTCTYSINGTVLDSEMNDPIPYVSVKVQGTDKITYTNLEGEFLLEGLCSDKNTLIVSCFDYCDSICDLSAHQGNQPYIYLTQEVHELETVVIKAPKVKEEGTESIAQTNLSKDQISVDPTQSLAALLEQEVGVSLVSSGNNVQLPMIHGLYGNRILILNNGFKHGFQNWGSDHAPEIDISSASNITIIKGASGVRFGPEALGGTIVVEPNSLILNKPFYAGLTSGFQTNGRGAFANLELGEGYKKWSYFLNGKVTKIGDRHTPDYSLTNSGKEEQSIGFGTRYNYKNWDAKVYYSYVNQNLALLRASIAESGNAFVQAINADEPTFIRPFSYDINEPNQLTKHHFAKAEINWWYSNHSRVTFRTGKQLNKRKEFDVRRNADKPIINLDLITSDYQLEWKHPDKFGLEGLLGLQLFTQDNDNNPGTGTTPVIPNYNTNRYSAFLVESKKIGKNTLEAGARLDHESNNIRGREVSQDAFKDEYNFLNFTSSVGYIREISDKSSFRTNLGMAWRSPNMAELYTFGQNGFKRSFGLLRYYTNEDGELRTNQVIPFQESNVEPEKGYKFISEFRTSKKKSDYLVTVYSHYIQNYVFSRPLAIIGTIRGPMPVFIFDQADALFLGSDVSWKKDWSDRFSGMFRASYLWSQNLSENQVLINQPPVTTSYNLTWNQKKTWKFESSKFLLKTSYTFKQNRAPRTISPEDLIDGSVVVTPESEIFDFQDAPNGYFLVDLGWEFKWKNFKGNVTIKNVFNTRYRDYLNEMSYFVDEPGRNISLTLNYLFKTKRDEHN